MNGGSMRSGEKLPVNGEYRDRSHSRPVTLCSGALPYEWLVIAEARCQFKA
jgi:hypothetical protein